MLLLPRKNSVLQGGQEDWFPAEYDLISVLSEKSNKEEKDTKLYYRLIASSSPFSVGVGMSQAAMPLYLLEQGRLGGADYCLLGALGMLSYGILSPIGGKIVDKIGEKKAFTMGFSYLAVSSAMTPFIYSFFGVGGLYLNALGSSFFTSLIRPSWTKLMMKNVDEEKSSRVAGIESAVDSLSYGTGAMLCGAMYDGMGVYWPIIAGTSLAVLSLPFMFSGVKNMKKECREIKTLFELLKEVDK